MHKSRRITVNLERAPSLSPIPLFWTRGACVYRFLSPRTGLLMRHDGVDFTDHPVQPPPRREGKKEQGSLSLSLSLPPFLEEQCDVAPHSSRSNVLVSPPVARIVCTRFLLCETGMVAMRCDAVRFGYGVVSTAPVCRQFSGGRPASPVVA